MTSTDDDFDPFAGGELTHTSPATEEQEEIWLGIQLGGTPANLAFNQPLSFLLEGELDVAGLERALGRLVERHEALRTTLSPDDAKLCVAASVPFAITEEAPPTSSLENRRDAAALACHQQANEPFDLVRGPLVRAHLWRVEPGVNLLLLNSHHLVCDGWSLGVLAKELGALYTEEHTGKPANLPPASSFTAYAAARKVAETSPDAERSRKYWRERFRALPAPLDLPLDHPRPAERTFAADRVDFVLPAQLVQGLRSLGAAHGASLVATLLAGFQVLLFRITGQSAIPVALPVAGQSLAGEPVLVGHCVRALPIRADLDPETPFAEHLASVKRSLLDAVDHAELSFGAILADAAVPRDPSRVPLAPVMFNVDQDPSVPEFAGLRVTVESPARSYENFEIFLNARVAGDEIVCETMFKTDLVDRRTMERRLVEYRTLLESAVANASRPIGDLEIMPPEEREEVLVGLNRTQAEVRPETVCGLFRKMVELHPNRPAVNSAVRTLTYSELDRASAALAQELAKSGIGDGHFVGVSLSRSVDLVVALLGIMRSGAAYVPLDPDYPRERLEFIANDSGIRALVTESALADRIPSGQASRFLIHDLLLGSGSNYDASTPEGAAYVIYTSGSTGLPKGVVVEHRNVSNFLASMAKEPGLGPSDVLVAITTPSFDISVLELFLPLTVGARVIVATREQVLNGKHLAELLDESGATVMQATPSGWRILLEAGWAGKADLKALTGGEALSAELAQSLGSRTASLWNMYGPTETTVWSLVEGVVGEGPITIGHPIANTSLYVLDPRFCPVPPGVTGELFIGGSGVTRGYWKRDELNRERFVPNPYASEPGARMYKTGDLVRLRWDGRLEWLGRSDFQVKVRGYRIELPEIEAALSALPGVREAVVIVREDRKNDQRIVGYVRATGEAELDPERMIEALRGNLPGYMVPQHVVTLEAFPQTPNGKIDRKALPAPLAGATSSKPPSTEVEKAVAEAVQELLGVERVGLDSDFFALGGHSLLAQRLTLRVRDRFGIEMPLRTIFSQPTVGALADFVQAGVSLRAAPASTSMVAAGETEEFVL